MVKDDRLRRDVHALDEHAMVLCNPRDKEAAHRAEMGDITIGEGLEVTCRKCLSRQLRRPRNRVSQSLEKGGELTAVSDSNAAENSAVKIADPDSSQEPIAPPNAFVRIRGLASMAVEYRPGDGVNPKEEKRQKSQNQRTHKPDYAIERLANQIFDAFCLSSLLSEIGMEEFSVSAVHPIGPSGQFLVEIQCLNPELPFDPDRIEQQLKSASGRIRCEISTFLHRKKAPELKFRVLPPASPPKNDV